MKGKYIPFLVLPLFAVFLLLSPLVVDAKDKDRKDDELPEIIQEENWVDTSLCTAVLCGTTLGTKTQAIYEKECNLVCPTILYEWSVKTYLDCPVGYSAHDDNKCKKNENPDKNSEIARSFTEKNYDASVKYEKSEDGNKCHRPSDNDLKNLLGSEHIVNDFKEEYSEHLDKVEECKDVVVDTRTVDCEDAIAFSCPIVKDEGDVLGTEDIPEVKAATTVVKAETGASNNILVYVVQTVLMLGTLVSGTLFVKKYII